MLVYDITNEKSFDNIRNWIRNIDEVILLLIHNLENLISYFFCCLLKFPIIVQNPANKKLFVIKEVPGKVSKSHRKPKRRILKFAMTHNTRPVCHNSEHKALVYHSR